MLVGTYCSESYTLNYIQGIWQDAAVWNRILWKNPHLPQPESISAKSEEIIKNIIGLKILNIIFV